MRAAGSWMGTFTLIVVTALSSRILWLLLGDAGLEALAPIMVEGKGGDGSGQSRLGPWLVTSCI